MADASGKIGPNRHEVKPRAVGEAIVFLVDWRAAMLRKECPVNETLPETVSLLKAVLQCIVHVMKTALKTRCNDVISIIAFGAGGKNQKDKWPGVHIIRPLQFLNADVIRKLEHIAATVGKEEKKEHNVVQEETKEPFKNHIAVPPPIGDDVPVQFDKALRAARFEFTSTAKVLRTPRNRRKMFVFTHAENPAGDDPVDCKRAFSQAAGLFRQGVSIDVTILMELNDLTRSMSEDACEGGVQPFFDELVYGDEEEFSFEQGNCVSRNVYSREDLSAKLTKKEMHKRAIFRTVFILGDDYKFGVALYSLMRKATRPSKVELSQATKKRVEKITTYTCEGVGRILKPTDIRYTYKLPCLRDARARSATIKKPEIGFEEDYDDAVAPTSSSARLLFGFTAKELSAISDIAERGLVLYGFRKRSSFKREYIMQAPLFVYPDEASYEGSTAVFVQLLRSLLKKDLIAIVRERLRRGSSGPRFAALLPQEETEDASGVRLTPGGFQMHLLPYKNDVYVAWREEMKKAEDAKNTSPNAVVGKVEHDVIAEEPIGTEQARRFIKRLGIKHYSPDLFTNADLQAFYEGLQTAAGVARDESSAQETMLNPNEPQMIERAGAVLDEFKYLTMGVAFDGVSMADKFGTKTGKRSREAAERDVKRRAKQELELHEAKKALDVDLYRAAARHGTLEKLLKTELVLYCKAFGIKYSSSSNKKNLAILIEHHFRQNQEEEK